MPVGKYQEGTATIELVDAQRNELVWQGTTTSVLPKVRTKATKQIEKAVETVFEQFPVQPK